MRISVIIRFICSARSVALMLGIGEFALSQSAGITPKTEQSVNSDARKSDAKAGDEKGGKKPFATFDADLNDDGIIDSVATLATVKAATAASEQKKSESAVHETLTAAFRETPRVRPPTPRNSCMDYLLLSPEEQARAIQKVQTRTVAVFGTRPCEPVVSPWLERPFDTNYAEIPFFPFPGVSIILRD